MSHPRSTPTLQDVARAAGVSTATVSRCLNAPERVQEETRRRVMKAVERLGYTPNFGARVMAARRTFTIGAIIPTMDNAIFARGLQAFQETLRTRGYTLLVSSTAYDPEIEEEQIRALVARGADGLLLIGQARDPAIHAYLRRQGVPTLAAWTYAPGAPCPAIGFDNRAAMRALAREVLHLGHRRIAVISGVTAGNDRATDRLAGIRDALAAEGLDPAGLPVIETAYGMAAGAAALEALMIHRPTAVICGNDVLAAGALRQARDMGLNVPRDVSITGFDNLELARVVTPELATVQVPHREMGQRAAAELMDMVEGRSTGRSVELPTTLRLRASLGLAAD